MAGTSGTGRAQRRRCLPSEPLGGRMGEARRSSCSSALPSRRGAGTVAWQPSGPRGQSSGDAVSAAALTGPRAAAQTGTQFRPLVRELVIAWTPRRHRLGGVSHGGAVQAVAAACGSGPGSLEHRSCASRTAAGHQRFASGWQRRRGQPRAAVWADRGGWDRAGARACSNELSTRLGKTVRSGGRTAATSEASVGCLPGEQREVHGAGKVRTRWRERSGDRATYPWQCMRSSTEERR